MKTIILDKEYDKLHRHEFTIISLYKRCNTNDIIHINVQSDNNSVYNCTVKCLTTISIPYHRISLEVLKNDCERSTSQKCFTYYCKFLWARYPKAHKKWIFDVMESTVFTIHCFEKINSFKDLNSYLKPSAEAIKTG